MRPQRNLRTSALLALLSIAAGAPLAACAMAPSAATDMASTAPMTRTPNKPQGSGLAVSYRIDGAVVGGTPTAVTLEFANVGSGGAQVRFSAEGGLRIASGGADRVLPAGQVSRLTITTVPPAAGTGYLHVFTIQNGATSATSVPLRVSASEPGLPAHETLKTTPGGEKIIAIPVE